MNTSTNGIDSDILLDLAAVAAHLNMSEADVLAANAEGSIPAAICPPRGGGPRWCRPAIVAARDGIPLHLRLTLPSSPKGPFMSHTPYIKIRGERHDLASIPRDFESPKFPPIKGRVGGFYGPRVTIHVTHPCTCGKSSQCMAYDPASFFPAFVCEACGARYLMYSREEGLRLETLRALERSMDREDERARGTLFAGVRVIERAVVAAMLGISDKEVLEQAASGQIPAAVNIPKVGLRWSLDAINLWRNGQPFARD